ncbi:MAG TPA: alpha-amylase family glycosyl hydrolase [Polyangiaceae bacterium]|nr:MAG: Cyclomaltodextrin glucanotransferase precursor [Deltaproteobacteria bacterium ADurb.Bin207]HNS98199.1 alpha-amylase family glycosyl hydrolase [Polyangiaceae bacterium]HNZ24578.1 alpha-amylase family glycosyl hydrolase [Polyangiaceae bacterium]HOE51759.1 alpha-amylase family glycosyl hydrolase [Polyangiaceae bacterium]HOH01055.1 alpha-amylase family glycosyl hydrolase [Polyangiaceae bacterium]
MALSYRPFRDSLTSILALSVAVFSLACGGDDDASPGPHFPDSGTGGFNPGDGGGGYSGSVDGGDGSTSAGSAGVGGSAGAAGQAGGPSCEDPFKRCPHDFTYPASQESSVELRGSFSATGWDVGIPLTKQGSQWSATVDIPRNFTIRYKYLVDGTTWTPDPGNTNTEPDGQGGVNSLVPGVECEDFTCATEPAPWDCPVDTRTCTTRFIYPVGSETLVQVAGSMNGWQPQAMNKQATSWVLSFPDQAWGDQIEYKFVVDGNWIADPYNPNKTDDGFGGFNSVLGVSCDWWTCGAGSQQCGDVTAFDWRDAVLYFAMVDRFRNSDGKADPVPGATGDNGHGSSGQVFGGDLNGVTQSLDYLKGLGVSALWLSAPFENRNLPGKGMNDNYQYSAYHGYWPSPEDIDYSKTPPSPLPKVESRIGTSADLKALVSAAHATTTANGHEMKVLFDYVMNHVDIESGLYKARVGQGWFAQHDGHTVLCSGDAVCGGECWDNDPWGMKCAFTDYLPAFDFDNTNARAWSINDAAWWAKEYGIDGYRLDAIKHVPLSWLTELRQRLTAEFPNPAGGRFYLVGETYTWDDYGVLKKYVNPNTMLDGQFDFPFRKQVCRAVLSRESSLQDFSSWMAQNDNRYGPGALMSTWIGNHDIPRVIHAAAGQAGCEEGSHTGNAWTPNYNQPSDAAPYERLAVAFAIMLTNPGLPMIYYGDEIGLAGGGDPDNRRPLPWNDNQLNTHQKNLRAMVGKLATIRGENKALTRGARSTLYVDADTWVYRMGGCTPDANAVVVAVHRGDGPKTVTVPSRNYTDLWTGAGHAGGSISLSARGFILLRED